ncbi:hypothetical protein BDC45DRAFT_492897 [Circinella umbellata]|nr:hypothetical protein BDC45DRAFT_492897 [Circinella umbellata]
MYKAGVLLLFMYKFRCQSPRFGIRCIVAFPEIGKMLVFPKVVIYLQQVACSFVPLLRPVLVRHHLAIQIHFHSQDLIHSSSILLGLHPMQHAVFPWFLGYFVVDSIIDPNVPCIQLVGVVMLFLIPVFHVPIVLHYPIVGHELSSVHHELY